MHCKLGRSAETLAETSDIRLACPKCETRYKIPAAKLTGGRKTLKCSNCGHSFPLRAPKRAPREPSGYVLRTGPESDLTPVSSLDTLKRWVIEGKVGPKHELSRPGDEKWQALADIEHFKPFFRVAERHSGDQPAIPDEISTPPADQKDEATVTTEDSPSSPDEGEAEGADQTEQAEELEQAEEPDDLADPTPPAEDDGEPPRAQSADSSEENASEEDSDAAVAEPIRDEEAIEGATPPTPEVVEPKPTEKSGSPVVPIFIILVLIGAVTALALLFFDVI